jgi:nucleotide-binding universal stress UspA family protein
MITIRTILVPTDFDDCSAPTVHFAAEMAEKFNARIVLLNVVQDVELAMPDAVMPTPVAPPILNDLIAEAKKGLAKVEQVENLSRFSPQLEVRVGSPAVEIVEAAKALKVDLICIGTHGRGGLAHFILGSVAEKVIRNSPCPVLTLRPAVVQH